MEEEQIFMVLIAFFIFTYLFVALAGLTEIPASPISTPFYTPAPTPAHTPTPHATTTPQTCRPVPPTAADITSLTVSTDKGSYVARETMNVSVHITTRRALSNITVEIVGIANPTGYDYVNGKETVSLPTGLSTHAYPFTLPTCSRCSGLSYGMHNFTVSILYNNTVLKNVTETIELRQEGTVPTVTPAPTPTEIMPGSDRDAHNCIGSAGYVWCVQKEKCLRLWEQDCTGSALEPQARAFCGGENVANVYICGQYIRVVSSLLGGGSTFYDGNSVAVATCPVVGPDSMSDQCRLLLLGNNCLEQEVC